MATAETQASGVYNVAVDGQAPVSVDGFSNNTQCSFAWSATDLSSGSHSVVVQLTGPSSRAGASAASAAGFELDGFMYVSTHRSELILIYSI